MKADLESFECKAFHQTMGLAFLLMGAMWENKHLSGKWVTCDYSWRVFLDFSFFFYFRNRWDVLSARVSDKGAEATLRL